MNEFQVSFLLSNPIINATIISWAIAQMIKVILTLITTHHLDFGRIFGSGGMPSSHSSGIVAMSVMVLRCRGFASVEFAISVTVALIVMYDAAGVRRATGQHATIINRMMELFNDGETIFGEKALKELIGHTPLQVSMGALLGILIGVLCPL